MAYKTSNLFSGIAFDQAHEQFNAKVKSQSGGLNLLNRDDSGDALLKWAVSSPEISRLTEEYELLTGLSTTDTFENEHHESLDSFQNNFVGDTEKLYCCIGFNPFSDFSPCLLTYLNSGETMINQTELAASLQSLDKNGRTLYEKFEFSRLITCKIPLTEAIKCNCYLLPPTSHKGNSQEIQTIAPKQDKKLIT